MTSRSREKSSDQQPERWPSQSVCGDSTSVRAGLQISETFLYSLIESICYLQSIIHLEIGGFQRLSSAACCFHVPSSPLQSCRPYKLSHCIRRLLSNLCYSFRKDTQQLAALSMELFDPDGVLFRFRSDDLVS